MSGADLVVFEGQAGQTACFRPNLRARGAGGELVIGSAGGALRVVVLGDGDVGRYAPPGSIVVEPLAFRLGLYLLPRGRRLRAERRAARQRLLELVTTSV